MMKRRILDGFAATFLTSAFLASAASAALLAASSARAEGLPKLQLAFPNDSTLRLYGQINKGILQYDDGQATRTYGLVDNDNSGTRFGLLYTQTRGAWTFENTNEFKYAPYSSSNVNILDPSPNDYAWSNANIRKIDFTFANDGYGKFWIGQGSMATDGISQIDLSGTDVIAYSSVGDSAAAQLLRLSDGTLSDTEIGDVFKDLDGDRRVRLRYDTPTYAHFTFAAAFGRNLLSDNADTRDANLFDAAIRYKNTFADSIDIQAGLGYNWRQGTAGAPEGNSWSGSASGLHKPTGLNLTVSAGNVDESGTSSNFWYTKLGVLRDYVSWGATAVSIDYYSGSDFNLDEGAGINDSSSDSWGLALVQKIDAANTELWLTYRSYDFADNMSSYQDGQAIFGGARFKF